MGPRLDELSLMLLTTSASTCLKDSSNHFFTQPCILCSKELRCDTRSPFDPSSGTAPCPTSWTCLSRRCRSTSRTSTRSSAWTSPSAAATSASASTSSTPSPRTSSRARATPSRRRPSSERYVLSFHCQTSLHVMFFSQPAIFTSGHRAHGPPRLRAHLLDAVAAEGGLLRPAHPVRVAQKDGPGGIRPGNGKCFVLRFAK